MCVTSKAIFAVPDPAAIVYALLGFAILFKIVQRVVKGPRRATFWAKDRL